MLKLLVLVFATVSLFATDILVSPKWLNNNLHKNNLRIVEVSNNTDYELAHIEGAVHTSIDKWRVKKGTYLTIRSEKEIQNEIQKLGINNNTHVVIYADYHTPKDFLKASYLFWALDYSGVKNISLLDGGLTNWIEKGYAITQKTTTVKQSNFNVTFDPKKIADINYVKSHIGKTPMIDARPSDKYLGITPTATVKRDGHIKGAMSYSWNYSVDKNFVLKSQKELAKLFKDGYKLDKNKEVIVYCTGGLETSFNYFVLSGVLGYKNVKLYDESMKQWGNLDNTPMEKYSYEMFK